MSKVFFWVWYFVSFSWGLGERVRSFGVVGRLEEGFGRYMLLGNRGRSWFFSREVRLC